MLDTVRSILAERYGVTSDVLERRSQIAISERVGLSKGEFRGVQNLLTHRLRKTLTAQAASRDNAYRFRAKAVQHLDLAAAANWGAERALSLVTNESLKMKQDYERHVLRHAEDIAVRKEEAEKAQDRAAARLRLRATIQGSARSISLYQGAKRKGEAERSSMASAMAGGGGGGGGGGRRAGGELSDRGPRGVHGGHGVRRGPSSPNRRGSSRSPPRSPSDEISPVPPRHTRKASVQGPGGAPFAGGRRNSVQIARRAAEQQQAMMTGRYSPRAAA